MKLSRKIFKIIGLALFISIVVIYFLTKVFLLKSFNGIEKKEAEDNTKRILNAIENDIDNISSLSLDYGIWDNTYEFMESRDPKYITSNFSDSSSLKKLGINYLMFVNNRGDIIYDKTIDTETPRKYILSERDLDYIKSSISSLYTKTNKEVKGILQLSNLPILIAGEPIVKSDGSGLPRGFIIMCKYLDKSEINHLSKDYNLSLELVNFDNRIHKLSDFSYQGVTTHIVDKKTLLGQGLLKDVFGDPLFVIDLKIKRTIYKEAITNINYFIILLASMAIIFNLSVLILLNNLVVKRIVKIKTIIDRVRETGDLNQRVDINGHDELTELGEDFNKMFEKLDTKNEDILKLAYYDPLTGLPNRKKLMESLDLMVKKTKSKFAVFFIDLDNFKNINDSLGHEVGDIILEKVANRFKILEKEKILISRVGGDEFVVVQKLTENNDAEKLAIGISKILSPVIKHNNREHYIGASIGISIYPDDGEDVSTLMKNADAAMYVAKKNKEHGYEFYSINMNCESLDKLMLENSLRKALNNNEFIIYYQPIKNVKENSITGTEALIRWNLNGKLVPPDEFIPIAKHIGEIVNIDNWVLRAACLQCAKWNKNTPKKISISVNISFKQLNQQNFILEVKNALELAGLEPFLLNLEITEDEAMEDVEFTINILHQLKTIGVRLSLDDFGTGYSSLSYVTKLPVDTLKIDRSLITHIHANNKNFEIVKSTIAMAHSLKIKVVAEGIENLEQLNILTELNCDSIQGFYISKPIEAGEFQEKFL